MKKLILASLATAGLLLAAMPIARANENCTGAITGLQAQGNVTVPNGATCIATNVVITGNIQVQNGASLFLKGGIIEGNVQGNNCDEMRLADGTVLPLVIVGNLQIQNCHNTTGYILGLHVENGKYAVVTNDIQCQNNTGNFACDFYGGTEKTLFVGHDVQIQNNTTNDNDPFFENATVLHDLLCDTNFPASPPKTAGTTVLVDSQCRS